MSGATFRMAQKQGFQPVTVFFKFNNSLRMAVSEKTQLYW